MIIKRSFLLEKFCNYISIDIAFLKIARQNALLLKLIKTFEILRVNKKYNKFYF